MATKTTTDARTDADNESLFAAVSDPWTVVTGDDADGGHATLADGDAGVEYHIDATRTDDDEYRVKLVAYPHADHDGDTPAYNAGRVENATREVAAEIVATLSRNYDTFAEMAFEDGRTVY